jgi:hypothetical protein
MLTYNYNFTSRHLVFHMPNWLSDVPSIECHDARRSIEERADLRDVTVKTEVTGASLSAPDFSAQPNRERKVAHILDRALQISFNKPQRR